MRKNAQLKSFSNDNSKKRNKNQFSFLFNAFTKSDWIEELTNVDSITYMLMKEEVEEFFYKTGGYLNQIDFELCYKLAIEATLRQIKKSITKNKKCFFENKEDSNIKVFNKIKQRLLNNIKNLFDSKRKINLLNFQIWIMADIYENHEIDFTVRDLKKLAKDEPNLIIEHIKTLESKFELTFEEIKELSEKLDINLSYFIESELSSQFKNLRKRINNQLYLYFYIKEEIA